MSSSLFTIFGSRWGLVMHHLNYFVYILKALWLRPAFAESYRLWRVTLSKELVGVHVWNAPDQWDNWRAAGVRATTTPVKLNVKTGPLLSLHLVFSILLVSVDCCFLRFSECFPVISCFCIAVQIPVLLLFLNYFLSFSRQRFTGAGVSEWTPAGVLTNFENR